MYNLSEFFTSPTNIVLAVAFFSTAAITTFDKRLIQAKKVGSLPADEPSLPAWVSLVYWVYLGTFLILLSIDWKIAIILFLIKFGLEVLPVLEIIGNFLMSPFKTKQNPSTNTKN